MDMYITVTSGKQDACDFISNFVDSIDIHDGYEVALTGIYHGPLFNIDKEHNKFTLKKGTQVVDYEIPPGYYQSTTHLVLAMIHWLIDWKIQLVLYMLSQDITIKNMEHVL